MTTPDQLQPCEIVPEPAFGYVLIYTDAQGRRRGLVLEADDAIGAELEALEMGYEVRSN